MAFEHPELRRKLSRFDRYAIWALNTPRGGGLLLPSLLLIAPAVGFAALTGNAPAAKILLIVFGVPAAALAVAVLARAIHVRRLELHHERHVEAFWDRKLKTGGLKIWLVMALQMALVVAALVVAVGYTSH